MAERHRSPPSPAHRGHRLPPRPPSPDRDNRLNHLDRFDQPPPDRYNYNHLPPLSPPPYHHLPPPVPSGRDPYHRLPPPTIDPYRLPDPFRRQQPHGQYNRPKRPRSPVEHQQQRRHTPPELYRGRQSYKSPDAHSSGPSNSVVIQNVIGSVDKRRRTANSQNIVNFHSQLEPIRQKPDSPVNATSSPKSPHSKGKDQPSLCRIPSQYRWNIADDRQFSVEPHLSSHWHLYKLHSLPRSYIIDSDDQGVQAIFRNSRVWGQMTESAYSIPESEFISSEERKDIEELGGLNSIASLEKYLKDNPLDPADTKPLKSYLFSVVYKLLTCYKQGLFELPTHEGWWISFMETIDNVMCHSGNFYNDRGEIRLHSDTLQKLQKRSSRCDAAITETNPYFEDCRRQFALIEGASHSESKKTWSDSLKVIQAGRDALAVIQRTSLLSRSALCEIAVPVFVYSGTKIRMSIISSPGGQTCWLQRFPVCEIPTHPERFPAIINLIYLFFKAKWVIEKTRNALLGEPDIDVGFNFMYSTPRAKANSKLER